MLFWIFVAILAIGIGCLIAYEIIDRYTELDVWGNTITTIAAIPIVISLVIIGFNHIGADATIVANQQLYESLVYQYENDIYENDNDLGKRELFVDIQEWNTDLARNKEIQDNFWIGIYKPNIYDQFDFIELE